MDKKTISIREAANLIGVSTDTLRRWDKSGKLPAIQTVNRGHRRYNLEDIELFVQDLFFTARKWASGKQVVLPHDDFHCPNSYVFKTRLDRLELLLSREGNDLSALIASVVSEIGNNSFDHNLGNWPDIAGVYFAYDLNRKIIVLADRGVGLLKTLKRVKPEIQTHTEALTVGFSEVITGRAPEHRGNGLKFVKRIVAKYPITLEFYTGNAKLQMLNTSTSIKFFPGCLALIQY